MTNEQIILNNVTEIKVTLAKFLVHQEQHAEKIKSLEEKTIILDAYRNNIIGKNIIISIVGGTIFGGLSAFIIRHL